MLRKTATVLLMTVLCGIVIPTSLANAEIECREERVTSGMGATVVETVCDDPGDAPVNAGGSRICTDRQGGVVPCNFNELGTSYWWSDTYRAYCRLAIPLPDPTDRVWDNHRDGKGNPTGGVIYCHDPSGGSAAGEHAVWIPALPWIDTLAYQGARRATASLEIHPAQIQVGDWRGQDVLHLSPWIPVGAPLWVWINAKNNPNQWGTLQATDSDNGLSVEVTATAIRATYDFGDNTPALVCKNPGAPRNYGPLDTLDTPSSAGCDHRYQKRNNENDQTERYPLTGYVTWEVKWTASNGEYGTFTIDITAIGTTIRVGELRAVACAPGNC